MRIVWVMAAPVVAAVLSGCGGHGAPSASMAASSTSTTTTAITTTVAAPPSTPAPRTVKWIDLAVGDCLAELPPVDQSEVTVTVVDCAAPHAAEMYLRRPIKVNTAIADVANQQCAAGLSGYTGRSAVGGQFSVTYLIDSNQDRTSNNPYPSAVICLLQSANGAPLTGSARD